VAHRLRPVVPSDHRLLHTSVHCSATRRASSPRRVKGVTPRRQVGLWERWVKLGTVLGRSSPHLCMGCAELSVLHRSGELSTGSTHRVSGQNLRPELRKQGYPRYPQPLLLLTTRESWESVSKWVLCTTGSWEPGCPSSRLDPTGTYCQCCSSDCSPVSFPAQGQTPPRQTTKPGRPRSAGNSRRRQQ
jgi:hypothetical protein